MTHQSHPAPFLLLNEPQIPPITVEAHITNHIPFDWATHCDSSNSSLGMMLTGGPLDLPFAKTIKVYKDVGDFSNDEDLTPSMIAFYQGVCGEEISKGKVVSSDKE
ncbi:hypothetical protein GmHk_18G052161 [Glycine max]|nr:hypothetical protein GmHk_18G052161 [Glycine max]